MSAYSNLEKQFSRLSALDHASAILSWDEAVVMPQGSGEARARAMAELKVLRHEILQHPRLPELVDKAEGSISELNPWQVSNLKEMKRVILSAKALSPDLVEASSLANSRCEQAWRSLRTENNWKDFQPLIEEVILLIREEAQQRSSASGLSPYDSLLDQFNPGLTTSDIEDVFNPVKSFLPDLIKNIESQQDSFKPISPPQIFSVEQQEALGLEIMRLLNFNFNTGRLDVSAHPFCGGVPQDLRITTRYSTSNFLEGLMGIIHETGHALYEQNLPSQWTHQPVGQARGMHIHESQSLFFEIFLGHSRSFLSFIYPILLKFLADNPEHPYWDFENLYRNINYVKPSLIRISADEVTYPAHVILRYEIERDLISSKIHSRDLPEIWDLKMTEYLGLSTRGNDRDGCMQDMHWAAGAFGYFPSYALGTLTAAQINAHMLRTRPRFEDDLKKGDLSSINHWLKTNIWSQGSFESTNDLLLRSTGESLNPQHFKTYVQQKYHLGGK